MLAHVTSSVPGLSSSQPADSRNTWLPDDRIASNFSAIILCFLCLDTAYAFMEGIFLYLTAFFIQLFICDELFLFIVFGCMCILSL